MPNPTTKRSGIVKPTISAWTGLGLAIALSANTARMTSAAPHALQALLDVGQRFAFVQYVVEHDDNASDNIGARYHFPHHLATLIVVAVAADMDVVEFEWKGQLWQQVTGKNHGTAHHAQHQRKFAVVGCVETAVQHVRHACHGRLHGLVVEQQFGVVKQTAGAVVVKFLHDGQGNG